MIRRPLTDVAAIMFDPTSAPLWRAGVVATRPLRPGPIVAGSMVEEERRWLGHRFTSTVELTDRVGLRFAELSTTGPLPLRLRYELHAVGSGTVARVRACAPRARLLTLAVPIIQVIVERAIAADLERLRAHLEGGGDGSGAFARERDRPSLAWKPS